MQNCVLVLGLLFGLGWAFNPMLAQNPAFPMAYLDGGSLGAGVNLGGEDHFSAVAIDDTGNTYVLGDFFGVNDFDPWPGSGVQDYEPQSLLLAKYDSTHQLQWLRALNCGGGMGQVLALDNNGDILLCGQFSDSLLPDPNNSSLKFQTSSGGQTDGFLIKYSSAGQFQWGFSLGGTADEEVTHLAINDQNDIYITGGFGNQVDFDPGPSSLLLANIQSASDPFLAKYSSGGNLVWAHALLGSPSADLGTHLAITSTGDVVLTGTFLETVDFDPSAGTTTQTSTGAEDVFVARYGPGGSFRNVFVINGTYTQNNPHIAIDSNDRICLLGNFSVAADLDPSVNAYFVNAVSATDLFLATYDTLGVLDWGFSLGGFGSQFVDGVVIDSQGRIFISGVLAGNVDFDPGPGVATLSTTYGNGAFVAAYSPTGSYLWADAWKVSFGYQLIRGSGLAAGSNGHIAFAGYFKSSIDLDPGPVAQIQSGYQQSETSFLISLNADSGAFYNGFVSRDIRGGMM